MAPKATSSSSPRKTSTASGYSQEQTALTTAGKKSGEFVYTTPLSTWGISDKTTDFYTSHPKYINGPINVVVGAAGVASGDAMVASGVTTCPATIGLGCAVAGLGVVTAAGGAYQFKTGVQQIDGTAPSTQGQSVIDSFNPNTPAAMNPLLKDTVTAGVAIGLGVLGGKMITSAAESGATVPKLPSGSSDTSTTGGRPQVTPLTPKDVIAQNAQRDDGQQYTQFQNSSGTGWNWAKEAPNNGAVPGTVQQVELPVGTAVDRFGTNKGGYLAPTGVPLDQRSMAPGAAADPYTQYVVAKPFTVEQSVIAPAFGQPGGALQYRITMTDGTTKSVNVQYLIDNGYLKKK